EEGIVESRQSEVLIRGARVSHVHSVSHGSAARFRTGKALGYRGRARRLVDAHDHGVGRTAKPSGAILTDSVGGRDVGHRRPLALAGREGAGVVAASGNRLWD